MLTCSNASSRIFTASVRKPEAGQKRVVVVISTITKPSSEIEMSSNQPEVDDRGSDLGIFDFSKCIKDGVTSEARPAHRPHPGVWPGS